MDEKLPPDRRFLYSAALADRASEFGANYPTGDTAAHIRKALGDDVKQNAIGEITGNTGAVRQLGQRLEAEEQGNQLWKEVQGNSRTAQRQQLDADLDSQAGTGRLSVLSPRHMIAGAIDYLGARATTQFRNAVKARVASIVSETNPATVQELMAQVAARADRDRDFAALLHRAGILGTKAAASNIVPDKGGAESLVGVDFNEDGTPYGLFGDPANN